MLDIYVINLDYRPDRLEIVREQLKNHPWQRISAVDARQLNFQKLVAEGIFPDRYWRDPLANDNALNYGEIACSLSHYKCWQQIKQENRPTLICEDDFYLISALQLLDLEHFASILAQYDILYLGYNEMQIDQVSLINQELIKPVYPYQTHAYCLSPAGAEKLLNLPLLQYLIPVDEILPLAIGCQYVNYGYTTLRMAELKDIYQPYNKLTAAAFDNRLVVQFHREVVGSNLFNLPKVTTSETHLVSWQANSPLYGSDSDKQNWLVRSAAKYDLAVLNLSEQQLWQRNFANDRKLTKLQCLREYAFTHLLDDDILIYLNGSDVLINDNLANIEQRFRDFDCDLVFAASKIDNGTKDLASLFNIAEDNPFRYHCPDMFIARAAAVKFLFAELIPDHEATNEALFYANNLVRLPQNGFKVILDYENYLFQTCADCHDELAVNQSKQVFNKITNCCSCILQHNGSNSEIFYQLLRQLNW